MTPPALVHRRIGVFGGTFDPVHLGHLILASELRHALALARVVFVPAGKPPHKPDRAITAAAHRLAMLRRAIADDPAFDVSTVDLDRPGPSFTVELLDLLTAQLAPATLTFLIGADSLRDLPTWREPARIAALAEFAVAARPDTKIDLAPVQRALPGVTDRIRVVPTPLIDISSSDIRRRVAVGKPIRYLVPRSVEEYIAHHGLYRP